MVRIETDLCKEAVGMTVKQIQRKAILSESPQTERTGDTLKKSTRSNSQGCDYQRTPEPDEQRTKNRQLHCVLQSIAGPQQEIRQNEPHYSQSGQWSAYML